MPKRQTVHNCIFMIFSGRGSLIYLKILEFMYHGIYKTNKGQMTKPRI